MRLRHVAFMACLLAGCDQMFALEERPEAAVCPDLFSGRRYRFVTAEPAAWATAEERCRSLQLPNSSKSTHLAVLTDVVELEAVTSLAPGIELWVGLNDLAAEGVFSWITSEPTDALPWDSTLMQPNGGAAQNCVIAAGGGMQDKECETAYAYVCECDDVPVDVPAR